MYLERYGIVGWEKIEAPLLAAVAADESILLVGTHGANKTEGSEALAKAVLGTDILFRKYDVPLLQMEDVLGYPDPNSIKNGTVGFLQTPLSIWTPDAVLLDEINRASIFMQAKLMEVIRAKTIMGLKTKLRLVISAVNPPAQYDSGYMGLALASRFSTFTVPDMRTLDDGVVDDILVHGNRPRGEFDQSKTSDMLQTTLGQVKITKFSVADVEAAAVKVRTIGATLNKSSVIWSIRQARSCLSILLKLQAFKATGVLPVSVEDMAKAVLSLIPEANGITRATVDPKSVEATVRGMLTGFELGDPIIMAKNLDELLESEVRDQMSWASAAVTAANLEKDLTKVESALKIVKRRAGAGSIELDLAGKVLKTLSIRKVALKVQQSGDLFTFEKTEELLQEAMK